MLNQIKLQLDSELKKFLADVNKKYRLSKLSPLLFNTIKNFVLRDGKRIRPSLFVIGYKGFSNQNPKNLYKTAIAHELLHDFLLIHDDIVDKSPIRRGKPSMHVLFNQKLKKYRQAQFNGEDLAIIAADIVYTLALECFLSINVDPEYKEKALRQFLTSSLLTGCGEFIEILSGAENIEAIKKDKILRIYDYKTAEYTFISPIVSGAIMAKANNQEIKLLTEYGICLGRAFQIKDDILGIFGNEKKTGKSTATDLQEKKKTLLVWHAYQFGSKQTKLQLKTLFAKRSLTINDIKTAKKLIKKTGSLDYAKHEVIQLEKQAAQLLAKSKLKNSYKQLLSAYFNKILAA